MKFKFILFSLTAILVLFGCGSHTETPEKAGAKNYTKGTFGYDLEFFKKHQPDLVVLYDESRQSQVLVLPGYQGRVMTSTAGGLHGASFGWVNHDLIASGKPAQHINAFGGEERFWLGPEGGQFSIFFKKSVPFTFDNWFVPRELDTEPFQLMSFTENEAHFEKKMHLVNYSETVFDLSVQRTIRLLNRHRIDSLLGVPLPAGVESVAFESENTLTNTGKQAWEKKSGLLSIWILSMLNATPGTTVAIPYRQGDEATLGKVVTDDYFGKVPTDRLKVDKGMILFKADGQKRSKIGIPPLRAMPLMASWDAASGVLTIAQFTLPEGASDYVNSLWEKQENPYGGDVANSYNDGPNDTGKQLGAFYELESSSPAAALAPGGKITHLHRTIHLKGTEAALEPVAKKLLGVSLADIRL